MGFRWSPVQIRPPRPPPQPQNPPENGNESGILSIFSGNKSGNKTDSTPDIVATLLKLQQQLGLSDRALAKRLGISHTNIYYLKRGQRKPSPKLLQKIRNTIKEYDVMSTMTDEVSIHRTAYNRQPSGKDPGLW
ncbi:helix-turn-helix domain-containing protein [Chloroflexota bacterium]